MSLANLDDDSEIEQSENQADWSEWLEDEPEVKTEFDLKSLNLQEATENWHNWEAENQAAEPQSSEDRP